MWGIEIMLEDGTVIPGCLFADGQVYVHEPVADSFGSIEDMKRHLPIGNVEMIGPVVAVMRAKERLWQDYTAQLTRIAQAGKELRQAKKDVQQAYEIAKRELEQYGR